MSMPEIVPNSGSVLKMKLSNGYFVTPVFLFTASDFLKTGNIIKGYLKYIKKNKMFAMSKAFLVYECTTAIGLPKEYEYN